MSQAGEEAERKALSAKAVESGKSFLSTLFMGIRTAQIHDPQNSAFEGAVKSVHEGAAALYAMTGGFSVQFVEESVFLNGVRLRFTSGAYQTVRKLRRLLESQEFGGVEMSAQPNAESIRSLLLLFSPKTKETATIARSDLAKLKINVLGIQRFSEGERAGLKIDRNVFALQCYAKLVLAVREQRERIRREREVDWGSNSGGAPRLRAMRVVQDLVELASDRSDFLLRLVANRSGAAPEELHAANVCLLAINIGHALEFARQELVDVGVAALFHDIAWTPSGAGERRRNRLDRRRATDESFARMLAAGGFSKTGHLRSVLVAEHAVESGDRFVWGKPRSSPHIFSRIVGAAVWLSGLTLGLFEDEPLHPLDALAILLREGGLRVDLRMLDVIVNLLRAYPVGAEVVLDDGRRALVLGHGRDARWDRPVVRLRDSAAPLDLMITEEGRFPIRIESTARAAGLEPVFAAEELPPLERTLASPLGKPVKGEPAAAPLEASINDTLELFLPDIKDEEPARKALTTTHDSLDLAGAVDELFEAMEEAMPAKKEPVPPNGAPPGRDEHDLERTYDAPLEPGGRRAKRPTPGPRFGFPIEATTTSPPLWVHQSSDPEDGTPLTILELDPEQCPANELALADWTQALEREGAIAAIVSHPTLPRLVDMGRSGPSRYLVYERVEADPLTLAMEDGRLADVARLRVFARSLAEGLHHLHLRRVAITALLPSQLAVTASGEARLTRLEAAVPFGEPLHPAWSRWTVEGHLEGSGDAAADQLALATLMMELLLGEPVPGDWRAALEEARAPTGLVDTILRMGASDRSKRFRNLDEVARSLTAAHSLARRAKRSRAGDALKAPG